MNTQENKSNTAVGVDKEFFKICQNHMQADNRKENAQVTVGGDTKSLCFVSTKTKHNDETSVTVSVRAVRAYVSS